MAIRWVIVRDPRGGWETRAYFSTCPEDTAGSIVERVLKRWTIETTFEKSRAHLGVETQRQWSDLAIERETPCLLGLYSVVVLVGVEFHRARGVRVRRAAWYSKPEASFGDILAAARACLWGGVLGINPNPIHANAPQETPRPSWETLLSAACYDT